MSETELLIRGVISTMSAEQQQKIQTAVEQITAVAEVVGEECWTIAIALLGARLSETT